MAGKLGPGLRYLISGFSVSDRASADVPVLLRGVGRFTAEQLDSLRAGGADIRSVAGDIATATVPLSALDAIADREFLLQVEGSGPLFPEGGDAGVPPDQTD